MNKELLNNNLLIDSCFIDNILINYFYSINNEINISNLKDKKIIFFLGENGSGKSILLKAILIGLKKYFVDNIAAKDKIGELLKVFDENKNLQIKVTGYQDISKIYPIEFKFDDILYLKNGYAYGTNRHKISDTAKGEPYGFLTLFKDDESLINTEEWLKKQRFIELENKEKNTNNYFKITDIENILRDLLEISDLKLEVNSQKVSYLVNNTELSLNQLSEGYKSVITFVIDLIARLVENNQTITKLKAFKAVVLIDELDMFLHPSWEKNICSKLHNWFPQIQFFITTHSPILVDGVAKNSDLADKMVLFRLKNENGTTQITERYDGKDIKNWFPNILISSPLFDPDFLDRIPKEIIINARTEDSYEKMKVTDINIRKLKDKEKELKKLYLEKLNKGE